MAVMSLTRCLSHMTISTAIIKSACSTRTSIFMPLTSQSTLSRLIPSTSKSPICRSQLHTSSVFQRNLDSRLVPIYKFPSNKNGRWVPRKKFTEMYEYTTDPLPFPKTGGRGPNGRIWNHRRGGGHKRRFRMIAWTRGGPTEGEPLVERVIRIHYDPNRSGRIALVANGEFKRYVLATQNMKAGDLIRSSRVLSKAPVRANEGDAYPLGSLPLGTLVSSVEMFPGAGGFFARAAGVSAVLIRKLEDTCIVRLPSRREMSVANDCVATVGRVSNVDHNKRVLGKAGRKRWLGIRPKSGRWHRKGGRFGRKIRPIKPVKIYDEPPPAKAPVYLMTHG